jgi:hypothetical protein
VSDERLRELYATAVRGRTARPGGEHPAPEAIAALVRREGAEEARLATLDHVMSCAECRRDFDLLSAVERAGLESGAAGRAGARRSWFMPAALAASLLIAIGLGRTLTRPADDITRGGGGSAIALLQPAAAAVAGDSLIFAWRPVPGASRYELELLDAGGSVAASAQITDTTASPAAVRALPPGEYHWWVRAATSDGQPLRSALRALLLTPR